ncbi:MAG: hypothetical protein ABIG93_00180 [archaeon]|nr:hypothetical protein [Nanoarchaeota archaeon]
MNTPLNQLLTSGGLDLAMAVLNEIRVNPRIADQSVEEGRRLDVNVCLKAANCYRAVGADDKAEEIMSSLYKGAY